MNILLTGVAGFIGCNLALRLLDEGHAVFGIDNMITGQRRNIEKLSTRNGFRYIEQDITYSVRIKEKIDWIMHFASPASPPKYLDYPIETLRVNSEGTYNLLKLALEKNSRFLLASTSEVYGDAKVHPQPESYWGNVNPNGLRSVYDEGKRYAEAITLAMHRKYNLPVRLIRIFNTYGPYMDLCDGRVVTNFIGQVLRNEPLTIYGRGLQTRSFQYIDDLITGILKLMNTDYFQPVNLGNPEEFTIFELASIVMEFSKSDNAFIYKDLPEDDPQQRKPDISTAKKILGWEPKVTLRAGIERTFNYFSELYAEKTGV